MRNHYFVFKLQHKAFVSACLACCFAILILTMSNTSAYAQSTPPADAPLITLHTRNNADIMLDLFATEYNSTIWLETSPNNFTTLTVHNSWTGQTYHQVEGNVLNIYGNLKHLDCSQNGGMLLGLDVSQNPELVFLYCCWTDITSLDVRQNPKLEKLYCSYTPLEALDLSQNPKFNYLNTFGSSIHKLNMHNGNNNNVQFFRATSNSNLSCIQVDDGFVPPASWEKDPEAEWNNDFEHPCEWWLSLEDHNTPISELKIYPNPAQNQLTIETNKSEANRAIEILDLSGKCIYRQTIHHINTTIDVSSLPKGMYLVKLNEIIEKLMIQ